MTQNLLGYCYLLMGDLLIDLLSWPYIFTEFPIDLHQNINLVGKIYKEVSTTMYVQ